jgi:hypothetical protein
MRLHSLVFFASMLASVHAVSAPINFVSSISTSELRTFDELVPGGPFPGTPYDNIIDYGGVQFGERFSGQTRTSGGPSSIFDVLSGSPTNPLTLVAGNPGQNLAVAGPPSLGAQNQFLYSLGPVGFFGPLGPIGVPQGDALGTGSIAVLFDVDQSQLGITLIGFPNPSITADFFHRDASLISQLSFNSSNQESNVFSLQRENGLNDIAGFSLFSISDRISIEELSFNSTVTQPPNGAVPEPGTISVIMLGMLGIAANEASSYRRRPRN